MFYNTSINAKTFAAVVDATVKALKAVDFDTIVFRGFSGAVVGPVVAYQLGKDWALVRKEGESSHSSRCIEGTVGARYVVIDDFMESGQTINKSVEVVAGAFESKCVGVYFYDSAWVNGCKAAETREFFAKRVGVPILNFI
jgi:adenine/guanine phosphoribosyltransferase-like PRPP-binding protein